MTAIHRTDMTRLLTSTKRRVQALLLAMAVLTACGTRTAAPGTERYFEATPITLPGGSGGIGFDDLGFSLELGRVLVPAGRTGNLDLVDPGSLEVSTITGFSSDATYGGGHSQGTTSVDGALGMLFAIDRTKMQLIVVDPAAQKIVGSVGLASGPDYIRYVPTTSELWITEPDTEQIEAFSLTNRRTAVHAGFISIKGGPESLVIDTSVQRAYTHLWNNQTVAIDVNNRSVVAQWPNGCSGGSRGIALDARLGFLFTGCAEGKATVVDIRSGHLLASLSVDSGVDVIAYNPDVAHLYVPSASSGAVSILGVSKSGQLTLLGTAIAGKGSHCVTTDNLGQAWVCDPDHGRLMVVKDPFASTIRSTP